MRVPLILAPRNNRVVLVPRETESTSGIMNLFSCLVYLELVCL